MVDALAFLSCQGLSRQGRLGCDFSSTLLAPSCGAPEILSPCSWVEWRVPSHSSKASCASPSMPCFLWRSSMPPSHLWDSLAWKWAHLQPLTPGPQARLSPKHPHHTPCGWPGQDGHQSQPSARIPSQRHLCWLKSLLEVAQKEAFFFLIFCCFIYYSCI